MKKGDLEVPPWETRPMFQGFAEKAGAGIKIFTSFVGAVLTGKIKITPITAIPNFLLSMGDFMSMMMGQLGEGPGGPGERGEGPKNGKAPK